MTVTVGTRVVGRGGGSDDYKIDHRDWVGTVTKVEDITAWIRWDDEPGFHPRTVESTILVSSVRVAPSQKRETAKST